MARYQKKKPKIIDDLDQKIIQELQAEGRQSFLSLGKKLDASEGTIRNRVASLIKKDLITLKAVLNPAKLGFSFSCVVGFEIAIDRLGEAESRLTESPNVYFLVTCTGSYDLIAFLIFRDAAELDRFMREQVARLPGIKRTQTFVNMNVVKSPWVEQIDISRLLDS
ncbi:MAG TPA: Lrp/AsnC family transcriptional regulator [Dehalococcoidales bacterium]|nr:Lrp/AsnC family transcriptional regulator [Dehalococcoidales bacterium]